MVWMNQREIQESREKWIVFTNSEREVKSLSIYPSCELKSEGGGKKSKRLPYGKSKKKQLQAEKE